MDRLRDEFPEDAGAAGASVSGWTRRTFLCSQNTGRVARCDGPFCFGRYTGRASVT